MDPGVPHVYFKDGVRGPLYLVPKSHPNLDVLFETERMEGPEGLVSDTTTFRYMLLSLSLFFFRTGPFGGPDEDQG